jgi:beta-glucosidase/6-phospho-beta-glucosidase/beta-galactosidase
VFRKFRYFNTYNCSTYLERYKVVPWGTRKLLNWINYNYKVPVLITENGMSDDGRLLDTDRIKYYRSYINEVLKGKYTTKHCISSSKNFFFFIIGHMS